MSKRAIAIFLLVLAAITLIGLLIWFYLSFRASTPLAQQPPQPQSTQQPATGTSPVIPVVVPPTVPVDVNSPAEKERQAQEALKRQAMDFTARVASYSSVDSFVGMKVVYTEVTPEVQAFLETTRKQLVTDHPIFGASWGQTTKSLNAKITSALPIIGKETAEVTLQVQQTIESPTQPKANRTFYQEAVLGLKRQGAGWIVTRVAWRSMPQP